MVVAVFAGVLLVVSLGVALGVFIGGLMLICVSKYMKRYLLSYFNN